MNWQRLEMGEIRGYQRDERDVEKMINAQYPK